MAKKLRLAKAEDVYAEVGRGALRAHEVLEAVFPELKRDPSAASRPLHRAADGQGDFHQRPHRRHLLSRSANAAIRCRATASSACIMPGKGAVIHTVDCAELEKAQDQHGRLAGRDLGRACRRKRAIVARVARAREERARLARRGDERDRQQWRQHLQS